MGCSAGQASGGGGMCAEPRRARGFGLAEVKGKRVEGARVRVPWLGCGGCGD